MAAFDYVRARSIAKGLIEKFGQAGEFIIEGSEGGTDKWGDPIPDKPNAVIPGTVTPLLSYKKMEVDGEQILATDSYVFFYCDEVPPIDSKATINSNEYRTINIERLDSVDGVNAYVKIQLRR